MIARSIRAPLVFAAPLGRADFDALRIKIAELRRIVRAADIKITRR